MCGKAEVIEVLCARGADGNAATECGTTPLMLAAMHGHLAASLHLHRFGASANAIEMAVVPQRQHRCVVVPQLQGYNAVTMQHRCVVVPQLLNHAECSITRSLNHAERTQATMRLQCNIVAMGSLNHAERTHCGVTGRRTRGELEAVIVASRGGELEAVKCKAVLAAAASRAATVAESQRLAESLGHPVPGIAKACRELRPRWPRVSCGGIGSDPAVQGQQERAQRRDDAHTHT
jgi:hypothetical protein